MSKKTGLLNTDQTEMDQTTINRDKPLDEAETDPLRLLHELQVHKIELETQMRSY